MSSFINIILGYGKAWGNLTRYMNAVFSMLYYSSFSCNINCTHMGFSLLYCRLFTPVIILPVVCVLGLGLFARGFPQVLCFFWWITNLTIYKLMHYFLIYIYFLWYVQVGNCVAIGLPMLILLVISQQVNLI